VLVFTAHYSKFNLFVFQELFKQHQVQHPVIIMNGMKFVDIKLVIEFMYRGEIKV
jgi:FixJ family two-component response regulator